jgi:SpoVK/Ycf46/Vps4 family AAA+-type ATPase
MLVEIKADTSAITSVKNDTTELRKLFVSKMKIDVDEKVFSWLSAPKLTDDHETIKKKRQPDTGLWFINGEAFTSWKAGQQKFMWLYGIPGCGKTVLR